MTLDWIPPELDAIRARGEWRAPRIWRETGPALSRDGRPLLNLASNDYLGLARHPALAAAAAAGAAAGSGATAARLLCGTLECHHALESELAALKGHPAALLFGSGYLAALGVIPALVGRNDLVVADRLCHACLLDGIRLSGARLVRFRHNDANHAATLAARRRTGARCLLVTESLFGMDGDEGAVRDLIEVARRHDAMLLVDEAHATGAVGPGGAGLVHGPDTPEFVVTMGTLGKAFAGYGGFVTGSVALRDLLINRARTFLFATALPPPVVETARAALRLLAAHPEWPGLLHDRARTLRHALADRIPGGVARDGRHVVPVLLGENERVVRIAKDLLDRGVLAAAIRPPTVPQGTARLRLSVTLGLADEQLLWCANAIADAIAANPAPR